MIKYCRPYFLYLIAFLGVILVNIYSVSAQNEGLFALKNYTNTDYGAANQNWGIVQDLRGFIYVGNNEGILEFDGSKWRFIKTPKGGETGALALDKKGRIYVGASHDLGYLQANATGALEFVSLLPKLKEKDRNFQNISKVFVINELVVFQSAQRIFLYENDSFTVIEPEGSFHVSFEVNDDFYVREWGKGLLKLEEKKLSLVPEGEKFAEKRIYALLPYEAGKILVFTRESGVFTYDGKQFEPILLENADFINAAQVYGGQLLNNGQYALNTLQEGVLIVNKQGRILQQYATRQGLQDNKVYSLFKDQNENLWVALNKGVAFVELNAPFSFWDERNGLNGIVTQLIQHKNRLIASTTEGVFVNALSDEEQVSFDKKRFNAVGGITDHIYGTYPILSGLLSAGLTAAYILDENQESAQRIDLFTTLYDLVPVPGSQDKALAGTREGFCLIQKSGTGLTASKINGLTMPVEHILPDQDGYFWYFEYSNGLHRVKFDDNYQKIVQQTPYGKQKGLPGDIHNTLFFIKNQLFAGTEKGIYRFDRQKDSFVEEKNLNKTLGDYTRDIRYVLEDQKDKLWVVSAGRVALLTPDQKGSYTLETQTFKRLNKITGLLPLNNPADEIIFSSENGLAHYSPQAFKRLAQTYFKVHIREVKEDANGYDTLFFKGAFTDKNGTIVDKQPENQQIKLPFYLNSLRFTFTATEYVENTETEYSYYLKGFDKDWSEWDKNTQKEYTNLQEGTYTFCVKARNIYGVISQESTYTFVILPPWYRTFWAYTFYVLFTAFAGWAGARLYSANVRKKNARLEEKIQERTLEITHQKEQLQAQEEELRQNMEELSATQDEMLKNQKELEGQMRAIDNSPIAKAEINVDGVILKANKSFLRIFGVPEDKDIGGKEHKFFRQYRQEGDIAFKSLIQDIVKGELKSREYERIDRQGNTFWVNATFFPVLGPNNELIKIIQLAIDITESKRLLEESEKQAKALAGQEKILIKQVEQLQAAQKEMDRRSEIIKKQTREIEFALEEQTEKTEQLIAQEEKLRQNMEELVLTQDKMYAAQQEVNAQLKAINNSSIIMVEFDPRGFILSANETFVKLYKYDNEAEIKGKHHKLCVTPEYADSFEYTYFWEQILAGNYQAGEQLRIGKEGNLIWINGSYSPVKNEKGEVVKILKLAFDITQAKQLYVEAQTQTEMLRAQEEEMRQNMEELVATQEAMSQKQQELESAKVVLEKQNKRMNSNEEIMKKSFVALREKESLIRQNYEQLQAQEEEMRQNMEELVATQEAMSQKQQELENAKVELERQNKKMETDQTILKKAYADVKEKEIVIKQNLEQMQAQEEELRQNMEELEATQEEMKRKQDQLEKVKEDLEIRNKKMQANEVILKKAYEKMKEQEVQIRQNLEELQAQEEELRQNMEELEATQEALRDQNRKIESKNRLITASIKYAQNIQQAILPSPDYLRRNLGLNAFVVFKPKDIVSGDFYWISKTEKYTLIAVVDCTGHGVPGAFMSMIGHSLLNEITSDQHIDNPGTILEELHMGIRDRLKQEETENHDGMDVCLCKIQYLEESQVEISFAGAKRPLYYIEQQIGRLNIVEEDRKSIGGWQHEEKRTFESKTLFLTKGDYLYLSTDGYADNPDPKRKKFGEKNILALLEKIYQKPLEEQENILLDELLRHQQSSEQRDDITFVGIKL